MFKKLFILPILGLVSFGAFASADDYVISDTPIPTDFVFAGKSIPIITNTTNKTIFCVAYDGFTPSADFQRNCMVLDDYGNLVPKDTTYIASVYNVAGGGIEIYVPFSVSNSVVLKALKSVSLTDSLGSTTLSCSSSCVLEKGITYYVKLTQRYQYGFTFSVYYVNSIVDNSSTDDGLYVPGIPDSFTSGLTNLINNFGSTIFDWLPTIILVSLGIYAIFALFRVVRNYARSSFNG